MVRTYLQVMDGIRSHYARTEGDDWAAAFSAVLAMSLLMFVNLASLSTLADLAVNGGLKWTSWITNHKTQFLPIPFVILAGNYLMARKSGIYQRRGTEAPPNWQRYLKLYVLSTVLIFLLPLLMIAIEKA